MKNMITRKDITIKTDDGATHILDRLDSSGFEAYIVGGAVRDGIINREICDYDVSTSASPEQVIKLFAKYKIVATGIKHGTVTVIISGKPYEITTFRCDGEYKDKRHPDKVEYTTNVAEDASRRDFTVNCLYYNPKIGILDFYDGLEDLKNGIIRTVGDADKRFAEDALRILRAVRFASKLGFKIEEKTENAMLKNKNLLNSVSVERIYSELKSIVCGHYLKSALQNSREVFFQVMPELIPTNGFNQMSLSHSDDVFCHSLKVVENCDCNDLNLRLAALFHDSGKPYSFTTDKNGFRHFNNHWVKSAEIASDTLTRLKAPKSVIKEVYALCLHHDDALTDKYPIKLILKEYGAGFFVKLLKHKYADLKAHSAHGIEKYGHLYYTAKKLFEEIVSEKECYRIKDLDVKGEDILRLNVSSVRVSEILNKLLDAVMSEKVPNRKLEILNYVRRNLV